MTELVPVVPAGPGESPCLVMGILNVTPDSFSDGGRFASTEAAVRHGLTLVADGADIIDVGGESTRPTAARVPAEEERRRVLPVIQQLVQTGVRVSVDTMRAEVAAAAVQAGAAMINDVSGGLADPRMAAVAAHTAVDFVAMHWRAHSDEMANYAHYGDVVAEVTRELAARLDALVAAGVSADRIIVDPGLGFAKRPEHNWQLLANLRRLGELGRPILVGASRKSFLGALVQISGQPPPPPADRDDLTCAVSALAAADGASCIRVHNVAATRRAVAVAHALRGARDNT